MSPAFPPSLPSSLPPSLSPSLLPEFPYLSTPASFAFLLPNFICHQSLLASHLHNSKIPQFRILKSHLSSEQYLEFTGFQRTPEASSGLEEDDEEDPEALPPLSGVNLDREGWEVNVLYSSTYRLPVCYFRRIVEGEGERDWEGVYQADAVTQGEHPLTGEIWWYIHPCQTGEAMMAVRELVGDKGEKYMAVWWGLISGAIFTDREKTNET